MSEWSTDAEPPPSRFADMFASVDVDPRSEGPFTGGELAILSGFLRWQRETLVLKCSGLDAEQLARRSLAPSKLSLLGLVRHLADVERGWFRNMLAGGDSLPLFSSAADPDGDFDHAEADPEQVLEAWSAWRAEVDFADDFVSRSSDLDMTREDPWRGPMSMRWVLIHVVEEYARHIGHADLLRERIDGAVGQ